MEFLKKLISGIGNDASTKKGLLKIALSAVGITITGGQAAAILCVYPAIMGVVDIFRKDSTKKVDEKIEARIARGLLEASKVGS